MLMKWGADGRIVAFLVLVLCALIGLNVWLCVKAWRRSKDPAETVIDWSQNLDEVEVDFPLPEGATSKDVKCRITSTTIHFAFTTGDTAPMLEVTVCVCSFVRAYAKRRAHSQCAFCRARSIVLCSPMNAIGNCGPSVRSHSHLQREDLVSVRHCMQCLAGAPTHAKLSLVKAKSGHWKSVLQEEGKKDS